MAVTILGRSVEAEAGAVAAERRRLDGLDGNGRAKAVRAAKQAVGLCLRTKLFPNRDRIPPACLAAAATLEAAGVATLDYGDPDL